MGQGTPYSQYRRKQTDAKACADTDFWSDSCFIHQDFFHYFCRCTRSLVHQPPYKNNKASDTSSNPDQLSQQQRFTAEGVFVCFVLSLALQGAGISQQTSSSRAEERG